jgi:beta-N-acetylhexosaminidase
MSDKIGSLIIDLQGKTVTSEDREIINHPLTGGIILFAHNYESREQLTYLCSQIRSARKTPLLIMVDQEGGRVQRFIHEFTRLPFMSIFGIMYDENPILACQIAKDCGWLMATELLSVGIDLSLAPVLDLNKGLSSIIGKRAFHANPEVVITIASAFSSGMHEAGMPCTGKHFPGHGSVQLDSHVANPIDERTLQEIQQDDMLPFAGMIKAGLTAIMAAHIVFPQVDSMPVGFSRHWLKNILRDQLGFAGAILSDDLSMQGANISANFADRFKAAREAGCDFILLCNNRKGVIQVLDDIASESHMIAREKWRLLQANFSEVNRKPYQENTRWKKTRDALNELTTETI